MLELVNRLVEMVDSFKDAKDNGGPAHGHPASEHPSKVEDDKTL